MNIFYLLFFSVVAYLLWSALTKSQSKKILKKKEAFRKIYRVEALSAEENFALSLGSLEYERLSQRDMTVSLKEYFEAEWGLDFKEEKAREHTLYTLQQIWSNGNIHLVFRHIQFEKEASIKEMVAFDSARFAELLRQAILLSFLDEEEAWGLLFLNAQRVQDSYTSWQDFKEAYFRGLTLYSYTHLEEDEQAHFNFHKTVSEFKQNTKVEIDWLTDRVFSHFQKEET
jgi:hypothetical protein